VDAESAAHTIALRLLESRPRTRHELATALARRRVPADAAEAVLDRLTEVGLIDDAAFASAWVDSRHAGRGLGRRALGAELRRKGVDPALAEQALAEVTTEDEETAARALVARRLRTMAGLDAAAKTRRLAGMLARKGIPPAIAQKVVREALGSADSTGGPADGLGLE
jgi:regulatory protein